VAHLCHAARNPALPRRLTASPKKGSWQSGVRGKKNKKSLRRQVGDATRTHAEALKAEMVTRAIVVLGMAGVLLGTAAAASTELTLQNFDEKVPPHAGVRGVARARLRRLLRRRACPN